MQYLVRILENWRWYVHPSQSYLDTCMDHVIHNIHVSSKLRNWTRIISLTATGGEGEKMSSRRGHSSSGSSSRYSSSSRRSPRRDSYGSSRYNSSSYDSYGGGGGYRDKKRYLKKKYFWIAYYMSYEVSIAITVSQWVQKLRRVQPIEETQMGRVTTSQVWEELLSWASQQ